MKTMTNDIERLVCIIMCVMTEDQSMNDEDKLWISQCVKWMCENEES